MAVLSHRYTIYDLAREMQKSPSSVRRLLRIHDVAKKNGSYGWANKEQLHIVAKLLKGGRA